MLYRLTRVLGLGSVLMLVGCAPNGRIEAEREALGQSAFRGQADFSLSDDDQDRVLNVVPDNCVNTPNPSQDDADRDGFGDACDPNVWRVEVETDSVCSVCTASLDFKLYWAAPLSAVTVPIVVKSIDPGAFWAPPLPQDYIPLRSPNAQGITWKWPISGWANIIQEVRPVEGCATSGNQYDGVPPDNFVITAQGSTCLPAQPNGWTVLTLEFAVTQQQGWFLFDTACATPSLSTIYMVDCDGINHGPFGTNETTFKPGVVKIGPCDCSRHCDLDMAGAINPVDVVMIVNCVYRNHYESIVNNTVCPGLEGDWNCDGRRDPVDVVHYVNYVYKGRTDRPPCNPCACDPYPTNCPPWP